MPTRRGEDSPTGGLFCIFRTDGSTLAEMNVMTNEELNLLAGKVFEILDEGIMVTDRHQTIVYVNATFTRLTGYSIDEVVGKSPRLLSSGRHSAAFYKAMWDEIHEKGSWQGEIWNKKKNGEIYAEELSITRVEDGEGRVTHYVGIFKDITIRKELEAKIRHQVRHDALTGLPNRILLQERLQEAVAEAERDRGQFAVLYADIDRFKQVNDNLGHHVGDKLLKLAADRIKECLSDRDTIARIGGDELVILLPSVAGRDECAAIADRILALFEKPFYIEGHELFVTCSIGISLYPEHAANGEELVKRADRALYEAKRAGRNNYRFFTRDAKTGNVFSVEKSLRDALVNQEFSAYFQPVFEPQYQTLQGAEALVRWNHPEKGMIPPGAFIPVAEESGLILQIDRWMLRQACLQTADWHRRGYPHLRVSVNVSMLQFRQDDLFGLIRDALEESGLPPSALILEITERTLMQDPESTIRTMHKIRDLGVNISLDDFGIGYSSFTYLKQLPIQKLKIDRSFTKDIASAEKDFLIVKALIRMARSLNLDVVAEGVETKEQLELLVEEQCDFVQGFYYGQPMSVADFERAYMK